MSERQRSYIVFGSTGEYSDRTEWPVVTYSVSMAAEAHRDLAAAWCRSHGILDTEGDEHNWMAGRFSSDEVRSLVNPFDPGMRVDYTGVRYFVKSVPARISSVRPL